jgi:hypothetical protein
VHETFFRLSVGQTFLAVNLCGLGEPLHLVELRGICLLVPLKSDNKSGIFWFPSNAVAEISMLQLRESTRRATTGFAELTMIRRSDARGGQSPHA